MTIRSWYTPYFEAIKRILEGTPVENLDEIRKECNKNLFRKFPAAKTLARAHGYGVSETVINFIANAENRILMGEDAMQIYSGFMGIDSIDFRSKNRKILEEVVKRYLAY